jgi:hypothetical protein
MMSSLVRAMTDPKPTVIPGRAAGRRTLERSSTRQTEQPCDWPSLWSLDVQSQSAAPEGSRPGGRAAARPPPPRCRQLP